MTKNTKKHCLKPSDVNYLAFQGGGGKAVAFLGAIEALEMPQYKIQILPVRFDRPSQIKGISGTSAGALIALLLALGYKHSELVQILHQERKGWEFDLFFDGPGMDKWRAVKAPNQPVPHLQRQQVIDASRNKLSQLKLPGQLGQFYPTIEAIAGLSVDRLLGHLLIWLLGEVLSGNHPLVKAVKKNPRAYIYNLIFDRGLFVGDQLHRVLGEMIVQGLTRIGIARNFPPQKLLADIKGVPVSFKRFHEYTKIDLVVTGTNISKQRPMLFSKRHTPDFPVAEAVAISMSLPFVFKPVVVETTVGRSEVETDKYAYIGSWVDGGMLNNLPLHAFDCDAPPVSPQYPHLRPLHPNMLGVRLVPLPWQARPTPKTFDTLRDFVGELFETLLYPSEMGQIRSAEEEDQTIKLFTYGLSTINFTPGKKDADQAISEALKSVIDYFKCTE